MRLSQQYPQAQWLLLLLPLLSSTLAFQTVPQQPPQPPTKLASASPLFRRSVSSLKAATEDKVVDAEVVEDDKVVVEAVEDLAEKMATITPPKDEKKLQVIPMQDLVQELELEAERAAGELVDDTCEVTETGLAVDEDCADEETRKGLRKRIKRWIKDTLTAVSDEDAEEDEGAWKEDDDDTTTTTTTPSFLTKVKGIFGTKEEEESTAQLLEGDLLEQGWEQRGNSSALRRNAEVWKFALKVVYKTLQSRKLAKSGASDEEVKQAKLEAAVFLRDGLLTLGPTFVKLGQVISTRTDVLPVEFTDTLKTLQDEVPGFDGARAKEIVSKELGRPCDEIFTDFSDTPLKAASLGQVHTANYKGQKVAIKVQRAGLKELFDVDLKNLRKLAELLDKFDPKSDGADRDWVGIYAESERLLYLEIDYLNEADNADRFAKDFENVEWVRVPNMYREVSTPRVLTMEFVESFKLTEVEKIKKLGFDPKMIAKRTADAFCRQIVETGYFHCDPHAGNFCINEQGQLVYYDFGMMDELKPNVRSGFRKFCTALFDGGPMVDDPTLAKNAKMLVDGVEEAGVLARGADRLAVEKLARYFMRTFKDKQLGKSSGNIKQTVGTDLQTLTENNVFRFPSTFTFIFRAFASIDGIGKELDKDYDIGKLAQPFLEKFIDSQKGYYSAADKNLAIFQKATGLNKDDIEDAVTSPRKIAYMTDTIRAMEEGNLKIRVRSLETEKALERMAITQQRTELLVIASLLLNAAGMATRPLFGGVGAAASAFFAFQAYMTNAKIKKFDKTQAKFVRTEFEEGDEEVVNGEDI